MLVLSNMKSLPHEQQMDITQLMKTYFNHEKLDVYQDALIFVKWASEIIKNFQDRTVVRDHLDRSSISIVLNIAEGNGKSSIKDRCRYFEIARASAFECAASLDILQAKNIVTPEIVAEGKEHLHRIISRLIKLNQSLMNRVAEESQSYQVDEKENENEQENGKHLD